jgi:hypothetical protein
MLLFIVCFLLLLPFLLCDWRGEKPRVITLAPKPPKSEANSGPHRRRPTPTTSKARPSFPSLGTAVRPPSAGPPPTQDLTPATSTCDSTSHDLRLLLPQNIDRAPLGDGLECGGSCPAPLWTCRCSGARGCALSGGQAMMRFSSAWKVDCLDVPSPGYWTVAKDTRILRPQDIERRDPTQQVSERRSGLAREAPT